MLKINTPLTEDIIGQLKAGDEVLLSGEIFSARDEAHKRLTALIGNDQPLPFELAGGVIYYVGPTPAKPDSVIGSAGPTTSYRMDQFMPLLLSKGLKATIGKGPRSKKVIEACKKYSAVYFAATGGAAALIARCVEKAEVIAFEELGPEAIRKLTVKDMPLIVINDCQGNDFYELGREQWAGK